MNRPLLIGAAAFAALSLAACSKPSGTATSDTSTQTPNSGPAAGVASTVDKAQDATSAAVGAAGAVMPTTAQGFAEAAANSDMFELKAAALALTRSKSPKIEAFAKQMIHDHGATTATLKTLVAKNALTLPTDTDARRTGMLDNLNSATPDGFDKTYLDQQVAAHSEAASLMKGYGEHGDNADLKAFAAKTAPKVQQHLEMVKALDEAAQSAPAKTPG